MQFLCQCFDARIVKRSEVLRAHALAILLSLFGTLSVRPLARLARQFLRSLRVLAIPALPLAPPSPPLRFSLLLLLPHDAPRLSRARAALIKVGKEPISTPSESMAMNLPSRHRIVPIETRPSVTAKLAGFLF